MKILVIDHLFHKKTKSSDFFFNILHEFAWTDIEYIDTEINLYDQLTNLSYTSYDRIIFWQIMPPKDIIPLLPYSKTILIPMYDACCTWTYKKWYDYRLFRFISFCLKIHKILIDLGIQSIYVKYAPDVKQPEGLERHNDLTAFIWRRTDNLKLQEIVRMFKRNGVYNIVCHGFSEDQKIQVEGVNIIYTRGWFKTHEEYLESVSKCHYFFAPRLYEGIGMGFLESMGLGLCVISPNQATMNEYIKDKENGYLFDSLRSFVFNTKLQPIVSQNAMSTYNEVKSNWENDKQNIIKFISNESSRPNFQIRYSKFVIRDIILLYNYRLKYFIKRKLNLLYY